MLIVRNEQGPVTLVEANSQRYVEKGRFDQPNRSRRQAWAYPVVANGHLDDYSDDGVPYRMRTQLFVNDGRARFDEAPTRSLGPHFGQPVLGRAVARLDWNRDGHDDFCMTHVDVPFSLLSNTTAIDGHSLTLSLRGVTSSREAIGTRTTTSAPLSR